MLVSSGYIELRISQILLFLLSQAQGPGTLIQLTYEHLSQCSQQLSKWPAGMFAVPGTSTSPVSLSHFTTPLLFIRYFLFYD